MSKNDLNQNTMTTKRISKTNDNVTSDKIEEYGENSTTSLN